MPRLPFQVQLYKWLKKHVQAGRISRDMANHIFRIAAEEYPGLVIARKRGRPGCNTEFAITLPGLDFNHNHVYAADIINKYLDANPEMAKSPKCLARFATVLKETGCWRESVSKKAVWIFLMEILDDRNMLLNGTSKLIPYNSFTNALKSIKDEEISYPRAARNNDIMKFKEFLNKEVERVSKIPVEDDDII